MKAPPGKYRSARGKRAYAEGLNAEALACAALQNNGWTILGQRLRTEAGEVDAVAERDGLVAFVEVKHRPNLLEAAYALTLRQRRRLLAAAEILMAENPDWGCNGVRFDVLLVDPAGNVRRVIDAFRVEET